MRCKPSRQKFERVKTGLAHLSAWDGSRMSGFQNRKLLICGCTYQGVILL